MTRLVALNTQALGPCREALRRGVGTARHRVDSASEGGAEEDAARKTVRIQLGTEREVYEIGDWFEEHSPDHDDSYAAQLEALTGWSVAPADHSPDQSVLVDRGAIQRSTDGPRVADIDALCRAQAIAGKRVEICGLQARPEMNGRFGHVVEWVEGVGRFKVRLERGQASSKQSKPLAIKPTNLLPASTPSPMTLASRERDWTEVLVRGALQWDEGQDGWHGAALSLVGCELKVNLSKIEAGGCVDPGWSYVHADGLDLALREPGSIPLYEDLLDLWSIPQLASARGSPLITKLSISTLDQVL